MFTMCLEKVIYYIYICIYKMYILFESKNNPMRYIFLYPLCTDVETEAQDAKACTQGTELVSGDARLQILYPNLH